MMDWRKVKLVKRKAKKSFTAKSYDDSFEFRKEAIELVNSGYNSAAFVIHSKISQTELMNKDYSSALEHANKSLELDSSFKKSMLRRAAANCELQNYEEAMKDLRYVFEYEPTNSQVISLMKRCCSDLPKMKQELRIAYTSYFLRRALNKMSQIYAKFGFLASTCDSLRLSLLRQMFLSLKNLKFVAQLLSGTHLITVYPNVKLGLHTWLSLQIAKLGCHPFKSVILSERVFEILFHFAEPGTFSLTIFTFPNESIFGPWSKYSGIYLAKENKNLSSKIDASDLRMIEQNAEIWTRLMYLHEIVKFKNTNFCNLRELLFGSMKSTDMEFLKLWQQNQWPVKRVVFYDAQPKLENFKQFDGVISNHVTTLYTSFDNICFDNNVSYKLFNDLAAFKRVFPSLTEVNITQNYELDINTFMLFIMTSFKQNIWDICNTIDWKPEWCSNLRFLIYFSFSYWSNHEVREFILKVLKDSINSLGCVKNLHSVGPQISEFNWLPYSCPLFTLKFETDAIQFVIEFVS